MALRQRIWAANRTYELRFLLGNICATCKKAKKNLEFDCIEPMGKEHHEREWSWRMSFYNAQYKAGNLQLLCPRCHTLKTKTDMERNPF